MGQALASTTLTRSLARVGLSRPGRGGRVLLLAFYVAVLACLCGSPAAAQDFPALSGRVVDQAGIIPPEDEQALTALLAAHEAKTTNQVVVATIATLGGREIEDFGVDLGRAWAIGQRDKNNGVILIVAPNERAVRIEVGYGVEGELTDAISRLIIESSILPRFRAGDMVAGIRRGAEDIVAVLEGDAAAFAERAKQRVNEEDTLGAAVSTIVFILIMMSVLGLFGGGRRRRYGRGMGPIIFGGGGGLGGSSGGGWSGGGGSFGGGGASGRW